MVRQTAKKLQHHGYNTNVLNQFWDESGAFILMVAVICIIAAIITKDVEMQNENNLTV